MPRPSGVFTYDSQLKRWRNQGGQLIPDAAVYGTAIGLTVTHEDALEMLHDGHVAGASTPEWLKLMANGHRQPCMTCGQTVGLGELVLTGQHSRDWGKER